ncbi:MAG: hypothetical protein KDE50_19655, partial [Caldilineaceae bacterium]|nr:hypothetical protein [Caldilineaceae bacterium]
DLIHVPFTYGECSDAWAVDQMWNSATSPSTRLWTNADSGISLTVESMQNGIVTLTIALDNVAPVGGTPTVSPSTTVTTTPVLSVTATPTATPGAVVTATESQTETPAATPMPATPSPVDATSTPQSTPTVLASEPRKIYLPVAYH